MMRTEPVWDAIAQELRTISEETVGVRESMVPLTLADIISDHLVNVRGGSEVVIDLGLSDWGLVEQAEDRIATRASG